MRAIRPVRAFDASPARIVSIMGACWAHRERRPRALAQIDHRQRALRLFAGTAPPGPERLFCEGGVLGAHSTSLHRRHIDCASNSRVKLAGRKRKPSWLGAAQAGQCEVAGWASSLPEEALGAHRPSLVPARL